MKAKERKRESSASMSKWFGGESGDGGGDGTEGGDCERK